MSKAGGLGVLGALYFTPDELEIELNWIDEHVDGKPYGVDLVMPATLLDEARGAEVDPEQLERELEGMISPSTASSSSGCWPRTTSRRCPRTRTRTTCWGGPTPPVGRRWTWRSSTRCRCSSTRSVRRRPTSCRPRTSTASSSRRSRAAPRHALKHKEIGVDIVVAQGTEAGGHTGEIASMVLWPEVIDAVGPDTAVLAAGGSGAAARSRPRWRWAPRACGPARSGSRCRRAT